VLSGGERARLALAKVIARRNNCLLLDEPTNNLDIIAKETLLEALKRFPGTVLIVSHDRFILNQLATQVIEVGHGQAIRYLGNYDDYLAKKATEASVNGGAASAPAMPDPLPTAADRTGTAVVDAERAPLWRAATATTVARAHPATTPRARRTAKLSGPRPGAPNSARNSRPRSKRKKRSAPSSPPR
jgi:ATP-binding cassette subfamily F protein 3